MDQSVAGNINFSMYDFPNKMWLLKPANEIAFKSLLLVVVIVFGVVGNLLLLNVIVRNRALHTPTNFILANMILADTLTLVFCPPLFISRDIFQNYVLGPVGCKMEICVKVIFLIAAVLNLCAVSYDRLKAIVMPLEGRITTRGAKRLTLLTWLASLAIASPFAIYRYYKERQWKNFTEKFCMENVTILPIYWHITLIMLVMVPLTVMIICYTAIFWKLDRYQQKVLKRENSIAVLCKTKVARMLFIIVTAFVLLHIPFTVVVFVRQTFLQTAKMNQVEGGFYILNCISHYCLYLNAAINPIIYGLTNDAFRRAYHQTPILPRFKIVRTTSKEELMRKPNTKLQQIVFRLTQETELSPTSNKSKCQLNTT